MNELLKVDHLTVDFSTDQGTVHAVRERLVLRLSAGSARHRRRIRFRQEPDDVFRHGFIGG